MVEKSSSYFSEQVSSASRFRFPKGKRRDIFEIESGGREECLSTYNVRRENFPHWVIEYVARGTAHIQLGRESWLLPPGSLYVYNRNLPHRIRCRSPRGMTKYFLVPYGTKLRQVLKNHGISPGHVIQIRQPGTIADIFEDIVRIAQTTHPARREACLGAVRYLLAKIEELTLSSERVGSGSYATYLTCLRAMEKRCREFMSIAQVATACQLDQAYICRLFRRFSDEAPYECLLRYRMKEAASLLKNAKTSVREVSELLGFSDAAGFSRAFKRMLGVSPANFQQGAQPSSGAFFTDS